MNRRLPLRQAYQFAAENGLGDEIAEIRSMAIDGFKYPTAVRRGYVAHLFHEKGILNDFIETHWPDGATSAGKRIRDRYENLRSQHLESLDGDGDAAESEEDRDEFGQSFALESHLRDFLAKHLDVLESGLTLYSDESGEGVEYTIGGGHRIDVLAIDREGRHVVVELKLSRGRNRALGQILYYMGWVDEHLGNPPCRGIIVAEEIGEDLRTAAARVPGIELYRYRVSMSVEAVAKGNILRE